MSHRSFQFQTLEGFARNDAGACVLPEACFRESKFHMEILLFMLKQKILRKMLCIMQNNINSDVFYLFLLANGWTVHRVLSVPNSPYRL